MYIQACMFGDNNCVRPRVHTQQSTSTSFAYAHFQQSPCAWTWCVPYMPALPSTLTRVNRQPCSVDNNLNVSPTHQHRLQPKSTSWVNPPLSMHISNSLMYVHASTALVPCMCNRSYAVSLNISSHLLHDGMFKSTSCVQAALSTFTTNFVHHDHVHTFYLSANACVHCQPRPYPSCCWQGL